MSTDFCALCRELTDVLAELPFGTCEELVVRARAALAEPDPPAEGEVRELVEWLSDHAAHLRRMQEIGALSETELPERLDRAAELIQQRHPEPVPVAERWPEFSDCDRADDRVWCFSPELSHWKLSRIARTVHSHWLPAHALPIPAGEVE